MNLWIYVNLVRGLLCPLSLPHEMNLWIYVNLVRGLNGIACIRADSPRIFTVQLFTVSAGDSAQTTCKRFTSCPLSLPYEMNLWIYVNLVRGLLCPLSLPHEMNLWIYVNLVRGLNGIACIRADSPRIFTVQLFTVSAGDSARTTCKRFTSCPLSLPYEMNLWIYVNPARGLLYPLSLPHEMNLWIYVNIVRGLNGEL